MAMSNIKAGIRNEMKAALKSLSAEDIEMKSNAIVRRLLSLPQFSASRVVCCYISMPSSEVKTSSIIDTCFTTGKRLFVPKVTGKHSVDLRMFEVESEAQLSNFPKSSWGIPEPPLDVVISSPDGTELGVIDLVIVPGVAFDAKCNRLGHGKGYYDCFLERLIAKNLEVAAPTPTIVGLCFDEQVVADVPHEPHDKKLDCVITPTLVFFRGDS